MLYILHLSQIDFHKQQIGKKIYLKTCVFNAENHDIYHKTALIVKKRWVRKIQKI